MLSVLGSLFHRKVKILPFHSLKNRGVGRGIMSLGFCIFVSFEDLVTALCFTLMVFCLIFVEDLSSFVYRSVPDFTNSESH